MVNNILCFVCHQPGRSLDVFITKLRNKLKLDVNISIINVRGIGYKITF
ncbi:MAG: helix-turn-helix domain-containing protein [Ferruginibacter sp.]|nr:helix-turn-helix domain-containing protein [Ferruginibacter sp.]